MEIIRESKDYTPQERYMLTRSAKIGKMRDVAGQVIEVSGWIRYTDTNASGELQDLVSIITPEGEIYATNSSTFIRELDAIIECFGSCPSLEVVQGRSKNGRTFLTCAPVIPQ